MQVNIKKLHENATIPTYANAGDACFDLYAATVAGFEHLGSNVHPGGPEVCGTGLVFEIPPGHVMLSFSRSGHGFKYDVRLANCVGVIDSGYRGEVMVKLTKDYTLSDEDDHSVPFFVRPGDRIAQAMIIPVERISFAEVDEISSTSRGTGGFGSSGA